MAFGFRHDLPTTMLILVLSWLWVLALATAATTTQATTITLSLIPYIYTPRSSLPSVLSLRAGSDYDGDGDRYDEEEEYDNEEGEDENGDDRDKYDHSLVDLPPRGDPRARRGPKPTRYDHKMALPPTPSSSRRAGSGAGGNNRRPQSKPKHWTQRMAAKSMKVTSQLAWGTVSQTGKVAYNLIKPKHIDPKELAGLWRLDQQIEERGDRTLASVATIRLDPLKRCVLMELKGKTIKEPFVFQKTRLGTCKTEFVAPAFLVGDTPRLYGYRGTWQRKMADKKVIKLVGKIYAVKKAKFGKQRGRYQFVGPPIGTFVARRRISMEEDDNDDDQYGDDAEYDDEYDRDEKDEEEDDQDFEEYDEDEDDYS
jgi:hypothetical protein